jgi:hypothetical protein
MPISDFIFFITDAVCTSSQIMLNRLDVQGELAPLYIYCASIHFPSSLNKMANKRSASLRSSPSLHSVTSSTARSAKNQVQVANMLCHQPLEKQVFVAVWRQEESMQERKTENLQAVKMLVRWTVQNKRNVRGRRKLRKNEVGERKQTKATKVMQFMVPRKN